MIVSSVNNISFKTNNDMKQNKNKDKPYLKYPSVQLIGAATGYLIPLKEIDGSDIVSGINGSNKLVMAKTKVPNTIGKWKNALIGAFIGSAIIGIYDLLKSKKQHN